MTDERRWHESNVPAARMLRRPMTATEASLWTRLRGRGLNGYKFRRQHPVGRFVLDFYCHRARLAVEVDGGIHASEEVRAADQGRQAALEEFGIRFVRLTNFAVESDLEGALTRIEEACAANGPSE